MAHSLSPPPTTAELVARFDEPSPPTIGLEEEIMVLDAATLDLAPRAAEVLDRAGPDPRFKPELVAAQLEIATTPCETVEQAIGQLADGRRTLAAAASPDLRLACAGAHPFAAVEGDLTPGPRYEAIAAEYGVIARWQLCSALQVHVAVRPATVALDVYNALRSHLPDLAGLAANAPFHGGRDTGLASIRPTIARHLPRQGIPPAFATWDAYADALASIDDPASWWWELRPHPAYGTLEIRVPDAQASVAEARGVADFAHALVRWLVGRRHRGETLPIEESWRIAERRWRAQRQGPDQRRLEALFAEVGAPAAATVLEGGGPAARLRAAADGDVLRATEHLADRFLEGAAG